MDIPSGDEVDLSLVIPCFNEEGGIPTLERTLFPVVEQLRRQQSVQVVLVDDGSRDDTPRLLDELAAAHPGVQVVKHARNMGLGVATRTGFAHARGAVVIVTDSDGTYPFTEIPPLLACLTPEVDIVTSSALHPAGGVAGVPAYRLLFTRGAALLYRILVRWDVHTYTAMFRAYRREVLANVESTAEGFLMPAEILSNAILQGYRVAEYPTVLHVRRQGQSKAKIARTILAHLRFQWKLFVRRLTGKRPAARER